LLIPFYGTIIDSVYFYIFLLNEKNTLYKSQSAKTKKDKIMNKTTNIQLYIKKGHYAYKYDKIKE